MTSSARFPEHSAFTLLELLLTIAIIALLASLLLPGLQRGQVKVKRLRCESNLHQLGVGMTSFAQGHEDKFPVQVSTNQGGSSEFIDAGNAVNREFYFAYKHFLPLSAELDTPKVLICPADNRLAATNFTSVRNTNLSYFVGADPQFGDPASILSGDRNLSPQSNSIARLRRNQPLKWTAEMHEYKGNVLFADGHVEMLNNPFSPAPNSGRPYASLVMPSAAPPPAVEASRIPAAGAGGASSPSYVGGNLTASFGAGTNIAGLTNGGTITNLTINSGPPRLPPGPFTGPGPGGHHGTLPIPSFDRTQQNTTVAAAPVPEQTEEAGLETAHQDLVSRGTELVKQGARTVRLLPAWMVVVLILACLWLLHRAHQSRLTSVSSKPARSFQPGGKGNAS